MKDGNVFCSCLCLVSSIFAREPARLGNARQPHLAAAPSPLAGCIHIVRVFAPFGGGRRDQLAGERREGCRIRDGFETMVSRDARLSRDVEISRPGSNQGLVFHGLGSHTPSSHILEQGNLLCNLWAASH